MALAVDGSNDQHISAIDSLGSSGCRIAVNFCIHRIADHVSHEFGQIHLAFVTLIRWCMSFRLFQII